MTNTYFNASAQAASVPAHLLPSQTASRAPKASLSKAPWVETGFVQIPIEFFHEAVKRLTKGAQRVYLLHCKHARAQGENAGFSYAYRETLARELGCSLSTIDRANAELEGFGLITDTGRRFQHGGAVKFQLCRPSKWSFDKSKNDGPRAQKCADEDALMRPITKAPKQFKEKEQQTASRPFLQNARENATSAPPVLSVVVSSSIEGSKAPEEATPVCPEEDAACIALQAQGVSASMSRHLVSKHGAKACFYQLGRLRRQKKVRNRAGWLNSALTRGDRDAEDQNTGNRDAINQDAEACQGVPHEARPRERDAPASLPPAPSPEEAERAKERAAARKEAREREDEDTAQAVLATLPLSRQVYIRRCMELEGASLVHVIRRDENYLFTGYWRKRE